MTGWPCTAAGIVDPTSGRGPELRCKAGVRSFQVTDAAHFAVEWADGTVTRN